MGRAFVKITPELFLLMQPQAGCTVEVVENDIPDDAKFVAISFDDQHHVCLIFESEKIPDTPHGQRMSQFRGPVLRLHDYIQGLFSSGDSGVIDRMQAYRRAIAMGKMTINECRERENLPSIGPSGDALFIPASNPVADEPIIVEAKQ